MKAHFRWIDWNIDHLAKHGVDSDEAEMVVENALPPYPSRSGDGKWLVRGPGRGGRLMQVLFIREDDDTLFVIHARPLNEREKKQLRRRRR